MTKPADILCQQVRSEFATLTRFLLPSDCLRAQISLGFCLMALHIRFYRQILSLIRTQIAMDLIWKF